MTEFMPRKNSYTVVSLFAGCGGLDLGFKGGFEFLGKKYEKRLFDVIWSNDIDENACLTLRKNLNHEVICGDIKRIIDENLLPRKADVVLGGFPCQDFSYAGKRRGFNSERGLLYQSMVNVVDRLRPSVFVAENVKGLITAHNGEALSRIKNDFDNVGYNVKEHLYLAADYEVPQMRQRIVFVGTRKDQLPEFVHPRPILTRDRWIPTRRALKDLENIPEGGAANHFWSKAKMFEGTQGNTFVDPEKPGPTMRAEHHGNIEWHWNRKRRLSAREAARLQSFPDDFLFHPSTSSAYRQLGNAVPPVLAWHIATALQEFLNANLKKKTQNDRPERQECLAGEFS